MSEAETSRSRVAAAMRLDRPRRVPVMCQLAIGHYFLHSGLDPVEIWLSSEAFAEALVRLQARYRFDGVLINLPDRSPSVHSLIRRVQRTEGEAMVEWRNGSRTVVPPDDNPHVTNAQDSARIPPFDEIDPEKLYYIDPWNLGGVTYPFRWDFEEDARQPDGFFPEWHGDVLRHVRARAGNNVSIHAEIFSPFSQFLELVGYQEALVALLVDRGKVKACLERLAEGAGELARLHAARGADAVLISSAFAGAGFISREDYSELVVPCEKRVVDALKDAAPGLPVYTHTCGAIGDRLDLMLTTGTNGIDTLDPPPLGTVELTEAASILRGKAFIKGNLDPVNTLLKGSPAEVRVAATKRLRVAKEQGGFILSSACSVAPHTPPENIELLVPLAEEPAWRS